MHVFNAMTPALAQGGGHGELDFMGALFVFMLATFIGLMAIQRVSRLLHTPLMSLTNAISAIAVVGAIIVAAGKDAPGYVTALGLVAIFCSTTNIVSGFLITDRMLKMFKKREGAPK
ncbi:MAG: NAD(P) transhydrogenase subunit alpha [Holophaga sp.]|nr:NAD(P) transhydrogenase subunit alpha [Holophaga sp.]